MVNKKKPCHRKPGQLVTLTPNRNVAMKITVNRRCQPLRGNTETRMNNNDNGIK